MGGGSPPSPTPHAAPPLGPNNAAPVLTAPDGVGTWFHDLPALAMIHGAIVATGTGTTPAGMAMALAYEHAPGEYTTMAT